jgi:hypothetical protein
LTFFLTSIEMIGQNTPPAIEWDFTSQSTVSGFSLDDNWAHSIIQTSDGNFVAAGFSDKYGNGATSNERHPAILKYNPGRSILWEQITSQNRTDVRNPSGNGAIGGFTDVIETLESNVKYVYACGTISTTSIKRKAVIAKYNLSTGANVFYAEYVGTGNNEATFFRMAQFPSTGTPTAIFICGSSQRSVTSGPLPAFKSTVFKISNLATGDLDLTFTDATNMTSGYKQYFDATDATRETKFRDISTDGAGGFVLAGSIKTGVNGVQPLRDALAIRIQANGTEIWRQVITEASMIALPAPNTYVDVNSATETPFCSGTSPAPFPTNTETNNEEAWTIERMPDGNFALLARFDWIEIGQDGMPNPISPNIAGCWQPIQPSGTTDACWPFNTEQYYDCDLALIKLTASTGAPLYSLDVDRSIAVDNWAHFVTSGADMFIMGSEFVPDNNNTINGELIKGRVCKVTDQPTGATTGAFNLRWRKSAELKTSFEFCPFGICLAKDGGVVLCGNNSCNGDDYQFIKWANDCHANRQFVQGALTIGNGTNTTWGLNTIVRGLIKIQAGGSLTINNNAIIQFANTYHTVDWYNLSQNLSTLNPTKIVVEKGGRLILDNCTLKGINACGLESMWEGIEVLGTPDKIPVLTHQGSVEILNNAKIINAYNAITAGGRTYDLNGRSSTTGLLGGGMVYIHHPVNSVVSHFQNCRFGVWFAPVSNTTVIANTYSIENTNFVNDAVLVDANCVDGLGNGCGPNSQLGSWNQDKIVLKNSKFSNTIATSTLGSLSRGIAVDLFDARLSPDACTFTQMTRGIYARYAIGVTDPLTVTNSTFTKTMFGINTVAGALHYFKGNTFSQIPDAISNNGSYGIRFDGSTNYTVEQDNIFNSINPGVFGIISDATLSNPSLIFKNSFVGVDFGVQTQGNNAGLQLRCNSHSDNTRAWSINPQSPGAGLFLDQGVCGTTLFQGGNVFSDLDCPGGLGESHIKSSIGFKYRSRQGASFVDEIPTCITPSLVMVNVCATVDNNLQTCIVVPPCTGCMASMQSSIQVEADPWAKGMLQNKLVGMMLKEGMTQEALDLLKPMSANTPSLYLSSLLNFDRVEEVKAALENLSTENVETKPLKKVFTILLDLKAADKNILNLNTEQENQLFEVATGTSQARFQAQSILEIKNGVEFRRPTEKWESHIDAGANERSEAGLLQLGSINLIPNPASNSVKIAWNLDKSILSGQITLTNIYGVTQKVQKIEGAAGEIEVDLQGLADGIYFVKVGNKTNFRVQKLLIQH